MHNKPVTHARQGLAATMQYSSTRLIEY